MSSEQLNMYCNHLFDESTDGYLHIAHINEDKTIKFYSTDNKAVREVVEEIGSKDDTFITPNTTYNKFRQTKNIRQFRALFIDLDIHKVGFQKAETVYMVWELFYANKIPLPTLVVDSGRGLHIYWRIEHAPFGAWHTWQELQDYLFYQLKHLGADKKATDSVRVLRLPSTNNSRNGEQCTVLYEGQEKYSMYDLREQYLNYKPKETQIKFHEANKGTSNKVIPNKFFNSYSLHLARIEDVETICKLRDYDMRGCRNAIIHCYAYWKGITIRDDERLREDVYALNNAFIEPLKPSEIDAVLRCIPKAVDKFIEYEQGLRSGERKRVSKGMRDKGGYWYKNETLIEIFEITQEEGRHLKTIISTEEKYFRNNKRRRDSRRNDKGLTEKQQELQDEELKVKQYRKEGLSMSKIANLMGISKAKVVKLSNL